MKQALKLETIHHFSTDCPELAANRAWRIGEAFLKGILLEVGAFSKPGLVCPNSNGAHRDMSVLTFMVGSAALSPAFFRCAQAGLNHRGSEEDLLPVLREIGLIYEQRLMAATGGINTQRGALFVAGILCGAAGLASQLTFHPTSEHILDRVKKMTKGLVVRELIGLNRNKARKTAGERLFIEHGLTGIRGEVEAGFPSVANVGLPAFRQALERSSTLNDSLVHTLLSLMTCVDDSTIVHRAGPDMLIRVKAGAAEVLALGSVFTSAGRAALTRLDREFIRLRISPGGSADLLAASISLYLLENGQFPVPII